MKEILDLRINAMRKIALALLILFVVQIISAQSDVRTPNRTPRPKTIKEIRKEDLQRRMADMRRLGQKPRERSVEKPKTMTREEMKKFKALTKPGEEDLARYKTFLKKKNTGIFRILPDFDCETKNLVRAGGDCKNFMPGTWMYSIRKKEYSSLDFHDLAFKRNRLVSNSLLTQGLMVSLGDVPLEKVSLDRAELKFLLNFIPGTDKEKAREQFEKLSKGIEESGFLYANNLVAKTDTTYVLRVVAYRFKDKFSMRLWDENIASITNGAKFTALKIDKRNDSVFAFRVIRKGNDGGITILWKQLQKQKSPRIVFEETEELKDFKAKKRGS